MDLDTLITLYLLDDDEDWLLPSALAIILVLGPHEAKENQIHIRNTSRRYLCRPQLLSNPRQSTPWIQLYQSMDDRAYITTMGFDVQAFHYLLENGFQEIWDTVPIPRRDVSNDGQPQLGK